MASSVNRKFLDLLEPRRLLSVTPQIHLLNDQDTVVAGQGLFADALQPAAGQVTNLDAGSILTAQYQWDFGDSNPAARFNNLPGWNVGHVYDTPGDYTLKLTIVNETGQAGIATKVIHVVAPSTTQRVINIDPLQILSTQHDGTINAPDIASATPFITNDTLVQFRRGFTYTVTSAINIPYANVTIGAFGEGTAPVLSLPNTVGQFSVIIQMADSTRNVLIRDLKFDYAGATNRYGEAIRSDGVNVVVRNCQFGRISSAMQNALSPVGFLALDNSAGTLSEYFAYVKGTDSVFLGNTAGDSVNQHNIRIYASRVNCYGNDLTNLPISSSINTLRVNNGSYIYWSNNTLHGGQVYIGPLSPASSGANPSEQVSWVVMENNRAYQILGNWSNHDRVNVDAGSSSVMIRNNYIEATDASAIDVNTKDVQTFSNPTVTVTRICTDVYVLNNTALDPDLGNGTQQGKKGCFVSVAGATTNAITVKNNLYVAQNLDTTGFTAAAVRVVGRNDLNNFTDAATGGGVTNNDWPKPANATTRGVHYVTDGSLTGTAAYRTPAEWASNFPGKTASENFEPLRSSDLDAKLAPPTKSAAATIAAPTRGVFADLYAKSRPGPVWSAGAVQLTYPPPKGGPVEILDPDPDVLPTGS